jgi:citrate synthase
VPKDTLSVTDNRTGKSYELAISDGTIKATELRQIRVSEDDFGIMTYDPAFMNTASCRSAITFIDGDKGILRYRGYPIEQLAEKCSFLEVAYLLLEGELPTTAQLEKWEHEVMGTHLRAHQSHQVPRGFPVRRPSDGHDAGRGRRALDVLSGREEHHDPKNRYLQRIRLIAKLPTIAAFAFRHSRGTPVRVPEERSQLHRQLRQHDVRDRRTARAQSGAAAGASRSC